MNPKRRDLSIMERVATRTESLDTFRHPPGFGRQYTSVYYDRLQQLKPKIIAPESWSQGARHANRVLDLVACETSWIFGTLTIEQARKPNILDDLKKINHGEVPEKTSKYCSPDDKVFLEDEHGRIEIVGELKKTEFFVTGLVVGILGVQNQVGEFEAVEVCYPSLPPQPKREPSAATSKPRKVALVSGIELDEKLHEQPSVELLLEFLSESPEISRLIICGNSLSAPSEELVGSRILRPVTSASGLTQLDTLLASLAEILPVHLMPGASDPTTAAFPQMPMHPALFMRSRSLVESMALVLETNPQRFVIDGVNLLGTSGQPIEDLYKYLPPNESDAQHTDLELLHKTILWRHMAPTAPNTLWSYPYLDVDPMVMDERPHVYFAGNCDTFETEVRESVRLICVPKFSKTGVLALLDLDTLEVDTVQLTS